jgi:hypothetical protein
MLYKQSLKPFSSDSFFEPFLGLRHRPGHHLMRSRTPPLGVAVSENSQPDAAQFRFATRPAGV